mmetsp:Transcript_41268/g.129658  ORF Transcript_41268/g.129658 Transcript_41268/m.129658 type:complete len:137 (+) Transcript_41268:585-995(+)
MDRVRLLGSSFSTEPSWNPGISLGGFRGGGRAWCNLRPCVRLRLRCIQPPIPSTASLRKGTRGSWRRGRKATVLQAPQFLLNARALLRLLLFQPWLLPPPLLPLLLSSHLLPNSISAEGGRYLRGQEHRKMKAQQK